MNEKLSQLLAELQQNVENYENDAKIDNDVTDMHFPEKLQHLEGEDYVLYNQKVIYWDSKNEQFTIHCLYNGIPCMSYKTIEGVLGFMEGENSGDGFPDYDSAEDEYHKAYCDGTYVRMNFWVSKLSNKVKTNIIEDGIHMNDMPKIVI
jgi:hypothetical protein